MVYVIQVCWQLVSRSICSCSQAVSKPVWHIPLLCVQWKTPEVGQRNCPKHVEFHSKNIFEKLMHLVGFIIRNLTRWTVTWTSNFCPCLFHGEMKLLTPQSLSPGLPQQTAEREMETKVWKFKVKASHLQNIKPQGSNKEKYQKFRLGKLDIHVAVLPHQKLRK